MRGTYEYGTSPLRGKSEKHVKTLRKQVLLMAVEEDENIVYVFAGIFSLMRNVDSRLFYAVVY